MTSSERMSIFQSIFYPKSIAVIGVSSNPQSFGTRQLDALIKFGYQGKLYPINPRGGEFLGLQAYQSVNDIPDEVDFAIIAVPAPGVAGVLEDCLAKGVIAAEILSSGFREVGGEGCQLEEALVAIAKKGIRIIGPNCFGIYCPAGGVTILPGANLSKETGSVALISQSGQFSEMIPMQAVDWGIRFSKIISYGNACDLNESDFLEYLAEDKDTSVIISYMEGVRDGVRFLEVARRVSRKKPVIIWRSGLSRMGSKAASSHTGSLGTEESVWNAFIKQSGVIRVDSLEELINTTVAFLNLPQPYGSRVGIVSGGGGGTVVAADNCERRGLDLPTLAMDIQETIRPLITGVGTSVANPVDIGAPIMPPKNLREVLEAVASSNEIDTVILRRVFLTVEGLNLLSDHTAKMLLPTKEDEQELIDVPLAARENSGKPVVVILTEETTDVNKLDFEADRRRLRDYYLAHGIPVYSTLEQAIRALAHLAEYSRYIQE